jgi:hypothetical protein
MHRLCWQLVAAVAASWLAIGSLGADWQRTQQVSLKRGWNVVWREGEPGEAEPAIAFANLPVTQVVTWYPGRSPVQYIQDPSEPDWRQSGWHKWLPPGSPDAFLTNLFRLEAGQGYLIHASSDFVWQIQGEAAWRPLRWQANSYNLVGFSVDAVNPPTFADLFAGSTAHAGLHAWQMVDGRWQLITEPEATPLHSGRAYWVYSRGESAHQGPLLITLPATDEVIDFGAVGDQLRLQIANPAQQIVNYRLTAIAGGAGGGLVPMALAKRRSDLSFDSLDLIEPQLASLSPQGRASHWLRLQRDRIPLATTLQSLLMIEAGGVRYLLPVTATRR